MSGIGHWPEDSWEIWLSLYSEGDWDEHGNWRSKLPGPLGQADAANDFFIFAVGLSFCGKLLSPQGLISD